MSFDVVKYRQELKKSNSFNSAGSSIALLREQTSLSTSGKRREELEARLTDAMPKMLNVASSLLADNEIEIVFFIDKSGSCSGLESSTISEYNKVIDKLKSDNISAKISTILFSDTIKEIQYRTDIKDVGKFEYKAEGGTSLYDTLCKYISRIRKDQKEDERKIKQTIVMIMTDGEDTVSKDYNSEATQKLVKQCKEENWIFMLIGSLRYTDSIARSIGIDSQDSIGCLKVKDGISSSFLGMYNLIDLISKNTYNIMSGTDEIKKLLKSDAKRLELKK